MKKLLLSIVLSVLVATTGCAQQGTDKLNGITIKPGYPLLEDQGKIDYNLKLNRAIELFLWSLPMNQSYAGRDALFSSSGGGELDFVYIGGFADHTKKLSTLNNEVVYGSVYLDLSDGPIVYESPKMDAKGYLFGSIIDFWQVALTDLGVPGAAPDGGKGGKYVILPPNFEGKIPDGFHEIKSPTFQALLGLRSVMLGEGTLDDAISRMKSAKIYPLSNPDKAQNYIDILEKPLEAEVAKDINVFKRLHHYVNKEPIADKDKYLVGMLASLGIEKGKPFPTDEKTLALLQKGAELGWMTAKYNTTKSWNPSLLKGWLELGSASTWTPDYINDDMMLVDQRPAYFTIAIWPPRNMGTSTYYSIVFNDNSDQPLVQGKNYVLHLPPNVPAKSFWSVIVYDAESASFTDNPEKKYTVNSLQKKLSFNEDGSIDVYFGPDAPAGKKGNWIPTTENDFFVGIRFYSPDWDHLGKTWTCDRPVLVE